MAQYFYPPPPPPPPNFPPMFPPQEAHMYPYRGQIYPNFLSQFSPPFLPHFPPPHFPPHQQEPHPHHPYQQGRPPPNHQQGPSGHYSRGRGRGDFGGNDHAPFECTTCGKEYKTAKNYEMHLQSHQKCSKCDFSAVPRVLKDHQLTTHILPDILKFSSQEDIQKWRNDRKKNFPSAVNIAQKKQMEKEKKERGETAQTPLYKYIKHLVGDDNNGGRRRGRGRGRGHVRGRGGRCDGGGVHGTGRDEVVRGEQDTLEKTVSTDGVVVKKESIEDKREEMKVMEAILADAGGGGGSVHVKVEDDQELKGVLPSEGHVEAPSSLLGALPSEGHVEAPSSLLGALLSEGHVEAPSSLFGACPSEELVKVPSSLLGALPSEGHIEAPSSHNEEQRGRGRGRGRKRRSNGSVHRGSKRGKRETNVELKNIPERKPTLLEKLLAPEVRKERNTILQCMKFIVDTGFLGRHETTITMTRTTTQLDAMTGP